MMIGQKGVTAFALACIAAVAECRFEQPLRAWSPYTWMREKEDRRLSEAIGKFFRQVKEDNDTPED